VGQDARADRADEVDDGLGDDVGGLDHLLGSVAAAASATPEERTRSRSWALDVLAAWDRQCAFCGYDGQLGAAQVGLEAAHVRWFTHDGPDDLDNGLALCAVDHKLLDRGPLAC
jgi:putative restriction endonuclease